MTSQRLKAVFNLDDQDAETVFNKGDQARAERECAD